MAESGTPSFLSLLTHYILGKNFASACNRQVWSDENRKQIVIEVLISKTTPGECSSGDLAAREQNQLL